MKQINFEISDYNIHDINTTWWKQIMTLFLREGERFEIRCWREEPEIIAQASGLGILCESQCTDYEVSITGILTDKIIQEILSQPKPEDDDQMTKFFTINIGKNFSSAHYGTEIYIANLTDADVERIHAIISPVKDYLIWWVHDMDHNV